MLQRDLDINKLTVDTAVNTIELRIKNLFKQKKSSDELESATIDSMISLLEKVKDDIIDTCLIKK